MTAEEVTHKPQLIILPQRTKFFQERMRGLIWKWFAAYRIFYLLTADPLIPLSLFQGPGDAPSWNVVTFLSSLCSYDLYSSLKSLIESANL
jgi:hypothetical protein